MMLASFTDEHGFICRIDLYPAHDCFERCAFDSPNCHPGTGGFHGVGSSRWRFAVIKDGDAAQFLLGGTYLPQTYERWNQQGMKEHAPLLGWDVGFHTSRKHSQPGNACYCWGSEMDACDLLGVPCWYDGSGLEADKWVAPFLTGKLDVWAALRLHWKEERGYIQDEYPIVEGEREEHT